MDAKRNREAATEPDQGPARSGLDELLTRPLLEAAGPGKAAGRNNQAVSGLVLGRIHRVTADGIFIEAPLLGANPVPALSLCPLRGEDVGRVCAVQFADGDRTRPCVLGCLAEGEAPLPAGELEADGQRLLIQAGREIELRCGESVIIMKRNGVIEIRGTYVTSQASATQRIRGGAVHVN